MLLVSALAATVPAGAATIDTRTFSSSFDGTGSVPYGTFAGVGSVAVHAGSGSVYVIDRGHEALARFDLSGVPKEFDSPSLPAGTTSLTGANTPDGSLTVGGEGADVAVDNSGGPNDGNIYVLTNFPSKVYAFDAAGNYLFQIGNDDPNGGPCGVAVDGNGHLRLADINEEPEPGRPSGAVTEFAISGGTATAVGRLAPKQKVCRTAVNSAGDVFAVGFPPAGFIGVDKYNAAGRFEEIVDPGPASAVAVDSETGQLLIASATQVREYDADGPVSSFGVPELGGTAGVAAGPGGRAYVSDPVNNNVAIFVPGTTTVPDATVLPADEVTTDSATLEGTIDPLGMPTSYRFEYRRSGVGDPWVRTATGDAGEGTGTVPVSAAISDLDFGTDYEVRLIVTDRDRDLATRSATLTFATLAVAPRVETIGWPLRSAGVVRLAARINPHGPGTTYHFEYGPTTAYGSETAAKAAGPVGLSRLVLEQVSGLTPGTTLHYRIIATNSAGSTIGEDRAVTSRDSDAPLSHGGLAGPPGSDRAWEQVGLPENNGNPASAVLGMADSGERVLYAVQGGTSGSQSGSPFSQFIAVRDASGWHSTSIEPPRGLTSGAFANYPGMNSELTEVQNFNTGGTGGAPAIWSMRTDGGFGIVGGRLSSSGVTPVYSDDLSAQVGMSRAALDPDYPEPSEGFSDLYDLGVSPPRLISLMPDGSVPLCGVGDTQTYDVAGWPMPNNGSPAQGRISADGSRVFFPSKGNGDCESETAPIQLYMREADDSGSLADGTTELISGPPVSGADFGGTFVAASPNDASDSGPGVIFWTRSRLVPEDAEPDGGLQFEPRDGDLYRYDVATATNECLTCGGTVPADVRMGGSGLAGVVPSAYVAVAKEGGAIYFTSPHRLVAGEGVDGVQNAYRLEVDSGEITYVATIGDSTVGTFGKAATAMSPDGSVLVFRSDDESLNQLTGSDNGGFQSYYRYDHRDRSLVCVSCPDAAAPSVDVNAPLVAGHENPGNGSRATPLSDDGTFFFVSDEPLLPQDQNTASAEESSDVGADVYEWRDGRLLLVTGGIDPSRPRQGPAVATVSASGRDVIFVISARLTPDAADAFRRTYDARIGGGFAFPPPQPPCSLDVCQGDPRGAPAEIMPGSSVFAGPGNRKAVRKCPKGKRRRGGRCVKKPHRAGQGKKHGKGQDKRRSNR